MKKRFLSLLLTGVLVSGIGLQPVIASAYENAVINEHGQRWENENNDQEENATRFNQINQTIYPMGGDLMSSTDTDWFVYQAKETKPRTFSLGYSSNINVKEAKIFLYVAEYYNGEYNLIFGEEVPLNKGKQISFDAVKGRDYLISIGIQGGDSELMDRIDAKINEFKEKYGIGIRYVMSIR